MLIFATEVSKALAPSMLLLLPVLLSLELGNLEFDLFSPAFSIIVIVSACFSQPKKWRWFVSWKLSWWDENG